MKPIPVVFHLGPLQVHTYGIGLAITFWFAFRYFERRLRDNGYSHQWLSSAFIWIVVSAIVGARIAHVVAHIGFYLASPLQILEVWHGGLSSFGGLGLAVPVGLYLARKHCPELGIVAALDLVAPVLMAAWAVGRLLGPQLMIAGGGAPTTAWYGMRYADQVGRRIPAPILQSIECFAIFGALLWVEKRARASGAHGLVIAAMCALWGVARFDDETFWLPHGIGGVAVQVTALMLAAGGFAWVIWSGLRSRSQPGPSPQGPGAAPSGDERLQLSGAGSE